MLFMCFMVIFCVALNGSQEIMIAIVDYGMGNLRSVQKALLRAGADARIVTSPLALASAEKIVLPGVGAFADAIAKLRATGLDRAVVEAVGQGVPLLGICLGFQLLFDVSYEDGLHTGLGLLPGKVVRFEFPTSRVGEPLKIPHMGWNQLTTKPGCPLFRGIENGSHVYFVHSYHAVPINQDVIAATTDYGYDFPAAIWSNNVFATQFHPEKSQAVGRQMLENFVNL